MRSAQFQSLGKKGFIRMRRSNQSQGGPGVGRGGLKGQRIRDRFPLGPACPQEGPLMAPAESGPMCRAPRAREKLNQNLTSIFF